jgi:hypothetical protein
MIWIAVLFGLAGAAAFALFFVRLAQRALFD